jgi:hypothetical protein
MRIVRKTLSKCQDIFGQLWYARLCSLAPDPRSPWPRLDAMLSELIAAGAPQSVR